MNIISPYFFVHITTSFQKCHWKRKKCSKCIQFVAHGIFFTTFRFFIIKYLVFWSVIWIMIGSYENQIIHFIWPCNTIVIIWPFSQNHSIYSHSMFTWTCSQTILCTWLGLLRFITFTRPYSQYHYFSWLYSQHNFVHLVLLTISFSLLGHTYNIILYTWPYSQHNVLQLTLLTK